MMDYFAADAEMIEVREELYRRDPDGDRVAEVIRDTLDQLYDGQRTGRWSYDQLHKTEKTHMGTLVEINLHREFEFEDGAATDYRIAGIEVDCKYSMSKAWMLPPEAIGHICLLLWADDRKNVWSAGLVRVREEFLNKGSNRDRKNTLSKEARAAILPLWEGHGRLAPNLFLEISDSDRERIFNARGSRGITGQSKVNELFRVVRGRIIRRAEIATVAQQDDSMKRARDSGGARSYLRPEGILVLGHQDKDPMVARSLGLDVPQKGQVISARVVPVELDDPRPKAEIEGKLWAIARVDEKTLVPAPIVPRKRVQPGEG
ncbi:NaeI family type II restriction endonuclease [Amycolatopsis sp. NPDC051071]|uniref:NaeI family type II restriction endonuclease n=1 Tax=Amycolatopsis sp. NPDC051071 TaxID=3154637 RepID=UPI0034374605